MDVNVMKCETCLSSDRQLMCISKIKSIINEIQLAQIISKDGGVCWECHSIITKFHKFRQRVQQAQQMLSTNIKIQQAKSLSTLSRTTKINYDYEYIYIYDPLKHEGQNVKVEPIIKTEELEILNSDTDEKPLAKIFADSIKITLPKERKRLHKKRSHRQNKKLKNILNTNSKKEPMKAVSKKENSMIYDKLSKVILKEKFETVIFSEEEMLKCREEKKNQANYKKIPYKCGSCVTGFTKQENYELHLKKVHDESIGSYTCAVCESRFATKAAESRHRARHYVRYRCRLCDYKVSSSSAAASHGHVKHAGDAAGRIHCKLCPFLARSSAELTDHAREAHSLSCNECGDKFKGRHTLRSHQIRIHSKSREFSCAVCLKTFTSVSRLESHSARHNNSAAYCALCRVQYKNVHVYRNHLRNNKNHVQHRIPCPACDKKFASRVYRNKHYNFYHLRRSRHKCEDCDKLFISEWRLKVHKQTQHGLARSRDHACNVCGKKFYTRATLASHSLLHAPRAYMCAACGAAFRQRAALHTHNRLHTNTRQ